MNCTRRTKVEENWLDYYLTTESEYWHFFIYKLKKDTITNPIILKTPDFRPPFHVNFPIKSQPNMGTVTPTQPIVIRRKYKSKPINPHTDYCKHGGKFSRKINTKARALGSLSNTGEQMGRNTTTCSIGVNIGPHRRHVRLTLGYIGPGLYDTANNKFRCHSKCRRRVEAASRSRWRNWMIPCWFCAIMSLRNVAGVNRGVISANWN